ncbi:MAG: helix-turn-helix transcriptional regulator [Alphaproteobacteria bacterium]|nr:helix-turn-helix transcriptional regulator [Alphaproteobacteria bacterium]
MMLRDIFARNVRIWRARRKLSQEALADAAKVSRGYMSDLERSVNSASLDVVERVAKALQVSPEELLARPARRPG